MTDLTRYPQVWCGGCEAVKPIVWAEMPADDVNTRAAVDLLCADCRLIIATLHEAAN